MVSSPLILTLSCPDRPGIVAAVSAAVCSIGGNILASQQFGDPESGLFFMRIELDAPGGEDALRAALEPAVAEFALDVAIHAKDRRVRTVIMVSKEGHCLSDLLYRRDAQGLRIDPIAIVGNHPDLAPLAQFHAVPFLHIPVSADTKDDAERRLLELVTSEDVELVVLARYMQILSDAVCDELAGSVINIHHSFLPSFKGARPYAQAHARGVKLIGATAHYVTPDLDEGPIIEQDVTRVTHADSTRDMVALGQDVERRVLAQAVRWHTEHRVLLNGERTVVFR